jgi:hypothetical protein
LRAQLRARLVLKPKEEPQKSSLDLLYLKERNVYFKAIETQVHPYNIIV